MHERRKGVERLEYLDLNVTSTLSGVAAVLLVAFFRLHWPFRFQYMSNLFRRQPDKMMRWLETSYRRNRSRTVAMLDKSTHEIMAGNYELAEKFIAKGLHVCKEHPSLFNQALVHYLFYNLAIVYFTRGRYSEALDIAFRVYRRDHSLVNALGIIACAHARLGEIENATEAYRLIVRKRSPRNLKLFCQAEIEAAKGNFGRAVTLLHQLLDCSANFTMNLNRKEIEKRLEEWTKASTQAG
jgi:tetratricopeptide (TPR) repeat protein